MLYYILSIIFGLIPEVLYLTLSIIYLRDIKDKQLLLFALLSIGYIGIIILLPYQILVNVAYMVYTYVIVKRLYKAHISDFFVITMIMAYQTMVAYVFYLVLYKYYIVYYLVARVFLFGIFIFREKIKSLYYCYKNNWNRKENSKIKSLTERNLSLLIMNALIVFINMCILLIIGR